MEANLAFQQSLASKPTPEPTKPAFDRFDPVVIVSAKYPALFKDWAEEHAIPFKDLDGYYLGEAEPAFAFHAKYAKQTLASGKLDGQKTLLFLSEQEHTLSGHRTATLVPLVKVETGMQALPIVLLHGVFEETDADDAQSRASYTHDPETGKYWVINPKPEATD